MTRANLLSQTREILGESTASTSWWDDNVLYQYIQDACNLISLAVPIEKFDTLITASGTFMYGLNSDFIAAKTIFRKAGTQITAMQQIKPEEYYLINIKSGDTLKIYFMIFGNDSLAMTTPKALIRPTPEQIDTYLVAYHAKPKFLTATDTVINIGQPFRTLIPQRAAVMAWQTVGDPRAQTTMEFLSLFLSLLPQKKTEVILPK